MSKRGKRKNADTHCDRMTAATDNRVNKINCSWCALENCFEFFFGVFHVAKIFWLDIFDSENYTEGGGDGTRQILIYYPESV